MRPAPVLTALVLLAGAGLAGCGHGDGHGDGGSPATPGTSTSPATSSPDTGRATSPGAAPRGTTVVATGLDVPWGLAFLPDGDALVSERDSGRLLRVPAGGGVAREVMTVPGVQAQGEGGLLGIAVSPSYDRDGLVFAYLTSGRDNRIVRFRLGGPVTPIVTGIPRARVHDGGRLAFGPDGSLYAGTGDAGDTANAQDPTSLGGKVLRMTPDGRPVAGASSIVLSTGHRNVQGLAFDAAGRLYATEFGQDTTDEVNQVRPGDNGGWPLVEGRGGRRSAQLGFAEPIVTWRTDEASPSGAAVIGDALYVAALRGQRLWRVPLDGRGGAGEPTVALTGVGRVRTAVAAPDGSLWITTSNSDGRGEPRAGDDRILRVTPR